MGWEDRPYYRDSGNERGGPVRFFLFGSIPLFTAFNVRVRAHASLLFFIALTIVLSTAELGIRGVQAGMESMTPRSLRQSKSITFGSTRRRAMRRPAKASSAMTCTRILENSGRPAVAGKAVEVTNKKQRRPVRGGVVLRVPSNRTAPNYFGIGTVAMVSRIRLAILYGSPWELGRRSSRYPL